MDREGRKQMAAQEKVFMELLKIPENKYCADCGARGPKWASWNLGVFLCINCGGVHRRLGTHVSKVKALTLDKWTPEQLDSMKQKGNAVVNKQCNPRNVPCPSPGNDALLERYIRDKYELHKFANEQDRPQKPTLYERQISELNSMGFTSQQLNYETLFRTKGNVEQAVEELVRNASSSPPRTVYKLDEKSPSVKQIVSMGFQNTAQVIKALEKSDGNVESAIFILTSDPIKETVKTPKSPLDDLLGDGIDPFAYQPQTFGQNIMQPIQPTLLQQIQPFMSPTSTISTSPSMIPNAIPMSNIQSTIPMMPNTTPNTIPMMPISPNTFPNKIPNLMQPLVPSQVQLTRTQQPKNPFEDLLN